MNNALDDHIKKQLGNYKPDVPSHIWENIVAERDKRKPVGFWLNFFNKRGLLILLAVLLTGIGVILYKNLSVSKENNKPVAGNLLHSTIETEPNTSTKNNIEPITSASSKSNKSESAKTSNSNATDNINSVQKSTSILKNSNKTSGAIHYKITGEKDWEAIEQKDESKNSGFKKTKHFKGKAQLNYKNGIAVVADENKELVSAYLENIDKLLLNRLIIDAELIRANNNMITTVKKPAVIYLEIPCPESEKNTAGNKRYVEIYGGPDYAFRSITDTGNSTYLQKRKESAHFSAAFSIGMRYTKVFNNGMSFRTGINYSQINEKFKYAEGNITQVIYITDVNGDTTSSYTNSGTRYKTSINKFRTLDIPLLIGYEVGNSRLHVNFNAGAIVNVYSWQKGDVLDTAYKPISITTGKTSSPYQFKTNVGIGFLGSVSFYYKLNSRLHILAEPYYRYNFSPASKSELTLKQKYNTAGIRIGLRLDF